MKRACAFDDMVITDTLRQREKHMDTAALSTFTIGEVVDGWFDVKLLTNKDIFSDSISYSPNDGLRDFLVAVNAVLPHRGAAAHCFWSNEPGFYRVDLTHRPASIAITIQYVESDFGKQNDDTGPVWFAAYCDVGKFARKVKLAYQRVLARYTPDQFKVKWRYDFPHNEFQALRTFLASYPRSVS
jgi:hypothetical protein